jgi:hypothetical protein
VCRERERESIQSLCTCVHVYIDSERETERDKREIEREREREREERREREDVQTFMCTHVCAADPLNLSRYPPAKRQEFTAWVPSAKFRALIAEQRAKETRCARCAPAMRLEITAAMSFNFALVRLGQHPPALGHSTRQLPRKDSRLKFSSFDR